MDQHLSSDSQGSASSTQPAPWIYINGYPGVGKLTIAKELCSLIEGSRLVSNHLTIDLSAALCSRDSIQYRPLRKALRDVQFKFAIEAPPETTWIFTDSSSEESGTSLEYQAAASARGSRFISIILSCQVDENLNRITGPGRGGELNTKLTDIEILCQIRETEGIFRFHNEEEKELDVIYLTASEAARQIFDHVYPMKLG